jgi:predicted alpha/beta-hydrolase family hydrolase
MSASKELRIAVEGAGDVSAVLDRPKDFQFLLVLAHGAGAGMHHPFLQRLCEELNGAEIATLRYQFPYMERRRGAPDRPPVLTATVAAAAREAEELAEGKPLLAGGKSMGGRMTSQAAAAGLIASARGLVFFGFPLHPPGNPGTKRAEHLSDVKQPMLFLQGTRDTFADLKLLRPVGKKLGERATIHIIETADHSFHVLKSSGKTDGEILQELATTTASWAKRLGT